MSKSRVKSILGIVLKMSVSLGLIFWLVQSGKLNLKAIGIFFTRFDAFLFNGALWGLGAVVLGSTRWFLLLKGIGLFPEFKRTIQLHLTGLFFNTALPGAIGGDIVKAVYIFKDQNEKGKTHALLTVLLDRIVGLYGLFAIAVVSLLTNLTIITNNDTLFPIGMFILALFLAMTLFFLTVFLPFSTESDPIAKFFSKDLPIFSVVLKVYRAFRCYKDSKKYLFWAFGISVFVQGIYILFYLFITNLILDTTVPIETFLVIVPVGILMTALPLAPGGLGVGHVAFDRLYSMVGLTDGANVFNVIFLGQMSLNLLGFIPYLFLKSKTQIKLDVLEDA